jgi:hypothetical protein
MLPVLMYTAVCLCVYVCVCVCRILGGRVDTLAEGYETQQKYGGLERPKAAGKGHQGVQVCCRKVCTASLVSAAALRPVSVSCQPSSWQVMCACSTSAFWVQPQHSGSWALGRCSGDCGPTDCTSVGRAKDCNVTYVPGDTDPGMLISLCRMFDPGWSEGTVQCHCMAVTGSAGFRCVFKGAAG